MLPAEHIPYKQIIEPIAIDVGDVYRHRRKRYLPHRQRGKRPKPPVPVVDPDSVASHEVVAHVQVRLAVVVEVAEHRAQSPIQRRLAQGLALFIQKSALGERYQLEPAITRVAVERVRLAQLLLGKLASTFAILGYLEHEPIGPLRVGQRPAIDRG